MPHYNHITICYFCTAFKDWAVNAVSGTGRLHSDNETTGMVVWMNCTLNPNIRGDIMLERYESICGVTRP